MKLVKYPDPILIQECQGTMSKVEFNKLANDMIELVKSYDGGIGLAAPQVGSDVRLFVMKMGKGFEVCYQPMVLWYSKTYTTMLEHCLSLPNTSVNISRPEKIVAEYTNRFGARIETYLEGIEAKCYQHELDHLNGILITNYGKTV